MTDLLSSLPPVWLSGTTPKCPLRFRTRTELEISLIWKFGVVPIPIDGVLVRGAATAVEARALSRLQSILWMSVSFGSPGYCFDDRRANVRVPPGSAILEEQGMDRENSQCRISANRTGRNSMTEAESKIIELLERINQQLSNISEGVAYVISRERVRDEQRRKEEEKLLQQARIGIPPEKE